jgi:hypothetical protein
MTGRRAHRPGPAQRPLDTLRVAPGRVVRLPCGPFRHAVRVPLSLDLLGAGHDRHEIETAHLLPRDAQLIHEPFAPRRVDDRQTAAMAIHLLAHLAPRRPIDDAEFGPGKPHGVALARMVRLKRPGTKVVFVASAEQSAAC